MTRHLIILTFLILFVEVYSMPGLPYEHAFKASILKDEAQHKDLEHYNSELKKGTSEGESSSGYAQDGGKKYTQAQDAGHYNHEDYGKKAHENLGNFFDENFHNINGGSSANVGKKVGHKKGHHKSGFHNSYHKDESASNSSFYDDGNDEGDEVFHDSRRGSFGNAGQKKEQGSHLDGLSYSGGQSKHGDYNTGGNYGNEFNDGKKYGHQRYYDDRDQRGASHHGNQYSEKGILDDQQYKNHYHRSPYHHTVYPSVKTIPVPMAPPPIVHPLYHHQQKITVYEDPRSYQGGYRHESYDYDPNIDYRPSPSYYGKDVMYDYYGY